LKLLSFTITWSTEQLLLFLLFLQHPRICEFPSKEFYNGKLQTALDYEGRGIRLLPIWPRRSEGIPMVFCHTEGAEKSLPVSTDDGNEQSKSNDAERDEAVSIQVCSKVSNPKANYTMILLCFLTHSNPKF